MRIFRVPMLIGVLVLLAVQAGITTANSSRNAQQATPAPTMAATSADPLGGATTFARLDKPTTTDIILDYTPNTNHLGIYVAQALGYYKDANLTVNIQQNDGSVQAEQVVATGKADFGISYSEETTASRAQNVPIVSIAAIIQHNTSGFAARHDKHPIKTPKDLAKLRYGSFGSDIEKPMLSALLACDSASAETIQFVDIGYTDPMPLMDKDRIDFVWLFYAWDGLNAKQAGIPLDFVMLKDYTKCVPDYYTPILITNESDIANRPDVVKAFTQATARGYTYAIQHPDEASDILVKAVPDLNATLVKESSEWLASQYQAEAPRWGQQSNAIWQGFVNFWSKASGKPPIDVSKAYT